MSRRCKRTSALGRWVFLLSLVFAGGALGCSGPAKPTPKKKSWRVEKRKTKSKPVAKPVHESHPHAHGGHPHSGNEHHHHPHPHPHLDGEDGHHHPY